MADMFGGALVSEGLKLLIEEAKKVKSFKPLSRDLASTMDDLIPLTDEIDSVQEKLDYDYGDLKKLRETIQRARLVTDKCKRGVSFFKRSMVTREIVEINKDMLKFCDTKLQLLQYRALSTLLLKAENLVDSFHGLSKRLEGLSVPAPVFRDLCSPRKLDNTPIGFDWPLMELKKKLLDDSFDTVLVSAAPGCGKTTLVTQLCHDATIKGKFEHIFFNVVSSAPNFRVLVQNLLQHNGYAPVTYENDYQAADNLTKLLEKLSKDGPILLVLDDVWEGSESLLENFRINMPDYKILVTSRVDLPGFSYTYHLKPLKDEDAKALLVNCTSRPDHASPAEYEALLEEILKRCNGFPLVIKVVGGSLKTLSLTQWQGQVLSWSKGRTVLDNPRPTVLDRLQPSFDALDPDLQQCFLDMGLFREDQKIRDSIIIDIWSELYCNGMTEKDKMILCMKYLDDLAAHNLLDLVPLGKKEYEDRFYIEYLATQHDILRELAISRSKNEEKLEINRKRLNLELKGDGFPDWCSDPVQPIIARLLSISTDNGFSSKWVDMDCPNVEALVLNISSLDYALPCFIARMKKLKVLTITNGGFSPARISNFSCLRSLPNLKRIRLEKVSITLLDLLQLQLISLEKLSLVMCGFGEVFYDAIEEMDVAKALPRLQEIDIDYCYDLVELPFWVCEVVSLKTLSITNCNRLTKLPEDVGKLSNLEVLRLSSCINLCELPETSEWLSNLRFLDISDCLGLRKLPLEIGKLPKLKKISMRKCSKCELPDSVRNLEELEVKCDEETRVVLWERLKPKMRKLRVEEEETDHDLYLLLHMF